MLAAQPDYGKQLTDLSTALQRIASAPDYTEQLNDISSALNRPTTPQWVFILGGAVLGAAFALLVQLLVRYVDAHAKRATMRKIVYREIIANYQRVHELMRDPALLLTSFADQWKAEIENLKTSVTYHGEEYCKGHLDTFAELPESASIDYAYAKFHQILSDNTSLRVNMRQAASAVAYLFSENSLNQRYVKLIGAGAQEVIAQMKAFYDENVRLIKEIEAKQ